MGLRASFGAMPFHFWSVVFFTFGCTVGSFLNVCIHRMPLGESIVSPPSHCPKCRYSIPWFLNIPLVTWLYLWGKCANCGAAISIRYFLVELLTGITFLGCWLEFGHQSAGLAVVSCLFLSGLIAASFIDLEHFIIPDEITIGGMVVGLVCSFLAPGLHHTTSPKVAAGQSMLGLLFGAAVVYTVLRLGKLCFGRRHLDLGMMTRVIFTETAIVLPGQEIPYGDVFARASDAIRLEAQTVELADRGYRDVSVRLGPSKLEIGEEVMNPDDVPYMEAMTNQLVLPREAMGLGDVKFMAAIGAFLGWQAVIFSLGVSSLLGSVVGLTLIATKKHDRSKPLQYGPFIAVAAAIWVFWGYQLWERFLGR